MNNELKNKPKQTQFLSAICVAGQEQKNAAKSPTRRYSRSSLPPKTRHCKKYVGKGTIMADKFLNRRNFVKMMGLGAAALAMPKLLFAEDRSGRKPNFVFFLIDDMGFKDIGCNGSSFYETPNIDRLAAGGMRFTDAYAACPVCSPTRASIMTGKYPARLNLTDYLIGRRRGKLIPPEYIHQMPLEEVTIAEALKEAGYTTCFIGKWHLGGKPYWPEQQGFDVNIGGTGSGMPRSYFWPQWRGNPPIEGRDGEYLTDRLTDEALKFLEAEKDKPFLLYLSHYAVHIPLQAKKEMTEKYKAKAARHPAKEPRFLPEGRSKARQVQDHPVYAGMVESVDESVGRVMKKLEELVVADNTVVIFMSDNGGLSTAEGWPTSNVPLRAGKGWLYEGGIREPMIIKVGNAGFRSSRPSAGGVVKPGSVCSEPVTSTDFYPTMLEMAGLPLKPKQHIDGVSLVPLLKGKKTLNREAIFWHYPHYGNQGGSPAGAVRAGDYKLIEFYEDNRAELYNLKKDISEKNNLAGKMPDKAAELRKMLQTWRKDVNAQMPTPNPDYAPEKDT
jgi:arylsulfatase A-like enzyme